MEKDIVTLLREFMDNEAKSCSMDYGCVTPEYVYRMWGGTVKLKEIEKAMAEISRKKNIYIKSIGCIWQLVINVIRVLVNE